MASFNYFTKEGDRIDTLAARFYGSNAGISFISDANPDVPMYAVYPVGTILVIPIVEDSAVSATDTNLLPPWKR